VGPRVIPIVLAQLLLHNNNTSQLVHTADQLSGDSSYLQTFTLRHKLLQLKGSQIPEAHWNQDVPLHVLEP